MKPTFSLIAILFGCLGTLVVVGKSIFIDHQVLDLTKLTITFLTCAAIAAGGKVCHIAMTSPALEEHENERPLVFFGGLMTIIVLSIEAFALFTV